MADYLNYYVKVCKKPKSQCDWVTVQEAGLSDFSFIGTLRNDEIPQEVFIVSVGTIITFFVLGYIGKSLLKA